MKYITEYDAYKQYDEMLDECYGETKIAGYSYQTSRVLKEVDPTAYRCGFFNWLDSADLTTDQDEADDEDEVTEEDIKEALGDDLSLEVHMSDGFTISAIINGEYCKVRYIDYTVPEACEEFRSEFGTEDDSE
jgi:hypothetical protein